MFLDPTKCQFAPADFATQVEGLLTHMLLQWYIFFIELLAVHITKRICTCTKMQQVFHLESLHIITDLFLNTYVCFEMKYIYSFIPFTLICWTLGYSLSGPQ
jgi:hypothetical protein